MAAASKLRESGIRTRTDTGGRKLRKSLASISAKGIRYALLIGESEAAWAGPLEGHGRASRIRGAYRGGGESYFNGEEGPLNAE